MKKKRRAQKPWLLPAYVLVALLLVSGLIFYKKFHTADNLTSLKSTTNFVYDCTNPTGKTIECEQKHYVELVKEKGLDETFAQLKADYANDSSVQSNCHQITHAIGREAAEELKTIEAAYQKGDNVCWSGYYHGVMEAVAKDNGKDRINNNLASICAEIAKTKRYSFYHYNCVHGLGHGLMAVNDNQLFDVLKLCDKYSDSWEQQSCYGGAFMENIMVSIQSGQDSDYIKSDQPMYPCTAVENRYKEQCYLMQTSQALRVTNTDYKKVFALCAEAGDYRMYCYQSMGRDASGNSTSNVERTKEVCMMGQSEEARSNCFVGAVKDFISYYHNADQASALCSSLQPALAKVCTQTKDEYLKTL